MSQKSSKICFKIVSKIKLSTEIRPSCRLPGFNYDSYDFQNADSAVLHKIW